MKSVKKELLNNGFLVPAVGSKKALAGKPQFSVNGDENLLREIRAQYFDPIVKISHLVRPSKHFMYITDNCRLNFQPSSIMTFNGRCLRRPRSL
jgi:hypothetical protein